MFFIPESSDNNFINQFFTILSPKIYHAKILWGSIQVKIYLLTTFNLPSQKPQPLTRVGVFWGSENPALYPYPPYPYPCTPKGLQTLAHHYQPFSRRSGYVLHHHRCYNVFSVFSCTIACLYKFYTPNSMSTESARKKSTKYSCTSQHLLLFSDLE